MSEFTLWLLIRAARAEAEAAWRRALHYNWRYQSVPPLSYLMKPGNQFGFRPLSWLLLGQNKSSLLVRIGDELAYLLHEEGVKATGGRFLAHSRPRNSSWLGLVRPFLLTPRKRPG